MLTTLELRHNPSSGSFLYNWLKAQCILCSSILESNACWDILNSLGPSQFLKCITKYSNLHVWLVWPGPRSIFNTQFYGFAVWYFWTLCRVQSMSDSAFLWFSVYSRVYVWLVWPGPKVYFQRDTSQGLAAGRVSLVNARDPSEMLMLLSLLLFILFSIYWTECNIWECCCWNHWRQHHWG